MRKRHLVPVAALTALVVSAGAPTAVVHAQDDFLFGAPKAQVTLRAGPMLHRASGDLMGGFMDELTLTRGDFRALSLGGDVAITVHPRLDVLVGVSYSGVESGSEFRDWVDMDDNPITQVTSLRVVPAMVSVRYFPVARGRSISNLAWLPTRTTPYIGAGIGQAWYSLQQEGEFVDFVDLGIFRSEYESSGRATVGQLFAGVDHWFAPRFGLSVDGRYVFGGARPGDDYLGWDRVDLSGIQFGLGLAMRW